MKYKHWDTLIKLNLSFGISIYIIWAQLLSNTNKSSSKSDNKHIAIISWCHLPHGWMDEHSDFHFAFLEMDKICVFSFHEIYSKYIDQLRKVPFLSHFIFINEDFQAETLCKLYVSDWIIQLYVVQLSEFANDWFSFPSMKKIKQNDIQIRI